MQKMNPRTRMIALDESDTEPIAFTTSHIVTDEVFKMTIRKVASVSRGAITYGDIVGTYTADSTESLVCNDEEIGTLVFFSLTDSDGKNSIPAGSYAYEVYMTTDTDEITVVPSSALIIKEKIRQ